MKVLISMPYYKFYIPGDALCKYRERTGICLTGYKRIGYEDAYEMVYDDTVEFYVTGDFGYYVWSDDYEEFLASRCDVRTDPELIKIVEECDYKNLKVVEIPNDINWEIAKYNDAECVVEAPRRWF